MAAALAIGIGTAVNVGMGIWGGNKAANAAAEQAEAQNRATQARYQYDLNMWDMKKQQLQANRQEAVDQLMTSARNEGKIVAYKDAANQDQYDRALLIRNQQQAGNEAAYKRSSDIYYDTTDLNQLSAKAAMDSNIVKLEESYDEQAFDRNEAYIDMLQAERMEATERIMASARNEGKIKAYKDVANEEAYDYNVKIRNAQQAGNEAAFQR